MTGPLLIAVWVAGAAVVIVTVWVVWQYAKIAFRGTGPLTPEERAEAERTFAPYLAAPVTVDDASDDDDLPGENDESAFAAADGPGTPGFDPAPDSDGGDSGSGGDGGGDGGGGDGGGD